MIARGEDPAGYMGFLAATYYQDQLGQLEPGAFHACHQLAASLGRSSRMAWDTIEDVARRAGHHQVAEFADRVGHEAEALDALR